MIAPVIRVEPGLLPRKQREDFWLIVANLSRDGFDMFRARREAYETVLQSMGFNPKTGRPIGGKKP